MAKRVLIVDDALIMRMRIKEIALEAGWEVAGEAANGEEGVARHRELAPDLTTLDIVMPKLDGVSALGRIMQESPNAKVVMVSAVDQKGKLAECIRLGAADFIVKPFDKSRLMSFFTKYGRPQPAATDSGPAAPSLYERLGGKPAIDAAVGLFYDKVLADERVRKFFSDVEMQAQMAKQRKFLAFAFGGPVKYDGRSLRAAHVHLNLDNAHFDVILGHLRDTLQQLHVPAELIDEAVAIASSTRSDVLNREERTLGN